MKIKSRTVKEAKEDEVPQAAIMCNKRSEPELVEDGVEDGVEEVIVHRTQDAAYPLGTCSVAGVLVLALLLVCTVVVGGYVFVKFAGTDSSAANLGDKVSSLKVPWSSFQIDGLKSYGTAQQRSSILRLAN